MLLKIKNSILQLYKSTKKLTYLQKRGVFYFRTLHIFIISHMHQFDAPCRKEGKGFGKRKLSDAFRILCELCFRNLSESCLSEDFRFISERPSNSFRSFLQSFRSVPLLSSFRILSEFFPNNCPTIKLKIQNYETIFG